MEFWRKMWEQAEKNAQKLSVVIYSVNGLNPNHFISRLSMIVRVNVVLNRTVVDSVGRFDNLCGSHLKSESELYTSVILLNSGHWSDRSIKLRCC